MGSIMIKCPVTGKAVPTGMGADKRAFEESQFINNSFGPCAACGQTHTWNKADAWVQE